MSALIKYTKSGQESKLNILGLNSISKDSNCIAIYDVQKPRGKKVGQLYIKKNGSIALVFGLSEESLFSAEIV